MAPIVGLIAALKAALIMVPVNDFPSLLLHFVHLCNSEHFIKNGFCGPTLHQVCVCLNTHFTGIKATIHNVLRQVPQRRQ